MDDADRSDQEVESLLRHYIDRVRRRADERTKPTGQCFNCEAPCGDRLFCCPECREDFGRRERITNLYKR